MFAETTSMISVIVDLITHERKTAKNMTKGGSVGMTKTSMPKVHSSGKRHGCSDGGCGGVDRVEIVGAVTSVKHHPGTGILNRKPNMSNSTVKGFSRVRKRTETRFLMMSGETSTLERCNGMELEGKAAWPA